MPTRCGVLLFLCIAAMSWLPVSGSANAAGTANATKEPFRHALIIGVAVYRDEEVPPLFGVPNDMDSAREIALAMGIPAGNITELFNESATKAGILAALGRLSRQNTDGGRILIYFSGHGTRWRDPKVGGCVEGLLTWDREVIVNREFAQLTRPMGLKADKLIIMFDACHSGGVAGLRRNTRSVGGETLSPKFFLRADASGAACSKPSNVRTRSLLGKANDGIEALPENVVHIMSARPDEVSFDEPSRGGLATQAFKGCLFGKAKDTDGSGAVTLAEIEECSQGFIREKVARFPDLLPHHVSITGLRNLVPVAVRPPAAASVAAVAPVTAPASTPVIPPAIPPAVTPTIPPVTVSTPPPPSAETIRLEKERLAREQQAAAEERRREEQRLAAQRLEQIAREQARLEAERASAAAERARAEAMQAEQLRAEQLRIQQLRAEQLQAEQERLAELARYNAPAIIEPTDPVAPPPVGPLASLKDLYAQRDTRRSVTVEIPNSTLRIGRDPFAMTVKSSHAGYVHVLLLGSDETSFYLLFPNALDRAHRIEANVPMRLPRPHWGVNAAGPPGTDQLLVIVTETPRRLEVLPGGTGSVENPFVLTPADLEGRRQLVDFMIGSGVNGTPRFGAAWTTVKEIP